MINPRMKLNTGPARTVEIRAHTLAFKNDPLWSSPSSFHSVHLRLQTYRLHRWEAASENIWCLLLEGKQIRTHAHGKFYHMNSIGFRQQKMSEFM